MGAVIKLRAKAGNFLIRNATAMAVVIITLLVVFAASLLYEQLEYNAIAKEWVIHTYETRNHIQMLLDRFEDAQVGQRGYILTGDERYLEPYNHAIGNGTKIDAKSGAQDEYPSIKDELALIKEMTSDNQVQQDYLDEIGRTSKEIEDYWSSTIALRKSEKAENILQKIDLYRGKELMDDLRRLTKSMTAEEDRLLATRLETYNAGTQKNKQLIFFSLALFYIIALAAIRLCQKAEKLAHAQLTQTAVYLKNVTDTIIDGLLVIDQKGNVQSLNPAALRMFGYEVGEVVGRNVKMLMPEPYHGEHDGYLKNYLASGKAKIIGIGREVLAKRKDGSIFPIELGVSEMRIGDKRLFAGTIRDISRRKQAEREIHQHIIALKQSNQELDDFAYIASHDLKEPLRGLTNNAMFLKEDLADKLDAQTTRRLDRMTYLCQRLERLVDDLLYFSRLGRQELAIQPTDLNEVIKDIKLTMETTLNESRTTIILPEKLPTIICDLPRITEVFRNLITNAVKYNKNSEKRIEIGCADVKLSADNDNNGRAFYVRDNGMGIPKQFHNDIFRIFKRLNEEDDSVKGTGVGLTFVRKIIERHGGRIWLDSEVGKGTTFYFTLNSKKEAAS